MSKDVKICMFFSGSVWGTSRALLVHALQRFCNWIPDTRRHGDLLVESLHNVTVWEYVGGTQRSHWSQHHSDISEANKASSC